MSRPRIHAVLRGAQNCESGKTDEIFDVFEELFDKRVIVFDREFTEQSCIDAIAKIVLLNITNTKKPIIILINSPGGEIYSSFGLVDSILTSKAPVYTVCVGMAASAAADLLVAGHRRFATPGSAIMVHQGWYTMPESGVTHAELLNFTAECERTHEQRTQFYIKRTGLSRKKIQSVLAKDSYFTAKDALALNMIDEIGTDIFALAK